MKGRGKGFLAGFLGATIAIVFMCALVTVYYRSSGFLLGEDYDLFEHKEEKIIIHLGDFDYTLDYGKIIHTYLPKKL